MSSTPPHLSLDNTMGAAFIGVILAACLYGVSCIQAWYYFTHQRDAWPIRTLVLAVLICDTLHQALICHALYKPLITNYGNLALLANLVWSDLVGVTVTGLTATLVQCFLCFRIWHLSNHNVLLAGVIVLLSLGGLACSIAFSIRALRLHTFAQLVHLKTNSVLVNAIPAACDVIITAALCTLLHKSRSSFQRSNMMINRLIIFAVNTGCFTSLCAIASLIANAASDTTYIYVAFYFCLGRLYTNSLLATLNAREMIRRTAGNSLFQDVSTSLRSTGKHPTKISINVDTQNDYSANGNWDHGLETTKVSARQSSDVRLDCEDESTRVQ